MFLFVFIYWLFIFIYYYYCFNSNYNVFRSVNRSLTIVHPSRWIFHIFIYDWLLYFKFWRNEAWASPIFLFLLFYLLGTGDFYYYICIICYNDKVSLKILSKNEYFKMLSLTMSTTLSMLVFYTDMYLIVSIYRAKTFLFYYFSILYFYILYFSNLSLFSDFYIFCTFSLFYIFYFYF